MPAPAPSTRMFVIVPLLAVASACAPRAAVSVGTIERQALAIKGQPAESRSSEIRPGARILNYVDGDSLQVEKGRVVAIHREPDPAKPAEATLQYWRHQWVGKAKEESEVPGTRDPHGKSLRQLSLPGEGKAVVFEPETGRVKRVVSYEAR